MGGIVPDLAGTQRSDGRASANAPKANEAPSLERVIREPCAQPGVDRMRVPASRHALRRPASQTRLRVGRSSGVDGWAHFVIVASPPIVSPLLSIANHVKHAVWTGAGRVRADRFELFQ